MDEEQKPEELRASELTLKKLGLVPPDFEYRQFLVKLLGEQVAGFYDPKTQRFYLADWIAESLDGFKPLMAHELTHALQDQHFDLRRFAHWRKGDSDAELAAHALVEGDATLLMQLYVTRSPARLLSMLSATRAMGASATEQIDKAPRALRQTLVFPYEQGLTWTTQLYRRGGWKTVSDAFNELPQSTEQVLHVEKYFAHEAPVKVSQPDLSSTLGANWKRIETDVNGEWSYYLILGEYLTDDAEAKRAAAGWGGDRYAFYQNSRTGKTLLAQTSVWDTEQDAREFFDAYAKRTVKRYKLSDADEIKVSATNANESSERLAWRTSGGLFIIERRGARIVTLDGLPENFKTKSLSKKLWRELERARPDEPRSS